MPFPSRLTAKDSTVPTSLYRLSHFHAISEYVGKEFYGPCMLTNHVCTLPSMLGEECQSEFGLG